jgi:DNA-binding CsgD family transcriptional regulator
MKYRSLLDEATRSLDSAITFEELHQALTDACRELDLAHLEYVGCGISGKRIALSTLPNGWTELYARNSFEQVDPVMVQTKKRLLPLEWSEKTILSADTEELISASRRYGARCRGLSMPIRGCSKDKGLLSVIGQEDALHWNSMHRELMPNFIYFAQMFHSRVVHCAAANAGQNGLAPREIDVLTWAALGKTAWETGVILSLQENTVVFYLRNACKKLKVRKKSEAIAKSLAEGLISV